MQHKSTYGPFQVWPTYPIMSQFWLYSVKPSLFFGGQPKAESLYCERRLGGGEWKGEPRARTNCVAKIYHCDRLGDASDAATTGHCKNFFGGSAVANLSARARQNTLSFTVCWSLLAMQERGQSNLDCDVFAGWGGWRVREYIYLSIYSILIWSNLIQSNLI